MVVKYMSTMLQTALVGAVCSTVDLYFRAVRNKTIQNRTLSVRFSKVNIYDAIYQYDSVNQSRRHFLAFRVGPLFIIINIAVPYE